MGQNAKLTSPDDTTGATVVITHRVRDGRQGDYEKWINEIGPLCRSSPGNLDWQIIRPVPGFSSTYSVIIRFDTIAHLRGWTESSVRGQLIERVKPFLASGDDFSIRSGLDFWFAPTEAKTKVPARWRQSLVTWSVIYPLVLGVPMIVLPALRFLGIPDHRLITTFVVTGTIVVLMVYVIMPRYTKLVKRWLFA
ncbi:antibiotic biosynthesis monooxygenase [Mesorhizobium loti R88b]|uniref:Antibiotic biosynthesis monooxygenase n=2 Tax=Rhizobium loti TaxID=381 RepID=A0A6M7WS86_RHILI|nr:antibiotic biosynthesis monooxygenase [Mesorhizobium loti R88b]